MRTVEVALDEWIRVMRVIKSLCDSSLLPVMLVKYETLCESPDLECARIRAFLGLRHEAGYTAPTFLLDQPRRLGLDRAAVIFLERELGPVDRIWPGLTPEEAIEIYAATAAYVMTNEHVSFAFGASGSILASGFSYAEPWGRWTDGASALLTLRHDPLLGEAALELDVALARAEGAPIEIRINQSPPATLIARASETLRIEVGGDVLRSDGLMKVELALLRPKTAEEEPLNDLRLLGVGLTGMRLKSR